MENTTSVQILLAAGVKVSLASGDDRNVRNMWFEAGWAARVPSDHAPDRYADRDMLAMALLARNNEEIFDVPVDHAQAFSVWEGNPLDYGAKPVVIFGRGKVERCWPSFE